MEDEKKSLLEQVLNTAPEEFKITLTVGTINQYIKEKLESK